MGDSTAEGLGPPSTDHFATVSAKARAEHLKLLTVCLFIYTEDKGSPVVSNCLCKGSEATDRGATLYQAHAQIVLATILTDKR